MMKVIKNTVLTSIGTTILAFKYFIMKHKRISFLFFFLFTTTLFSQEFLKEKLVLNAGDLTVEKIRNKLTNYYARGIPKKTLDLKQDIIQYNSNNEKKLIKILDIRDQWVKKHQELTQKNDIASLTQRKEEEKEKYIEIKEGVEKNLTTISYRGIYIYVKRNIKIGAKKSTLIDEVKGQISPIAIPKINGSFIKSINSYQRKNDIDNFSKYIQERISGKLEITDSSNDYLVGDKLFWYIGVAGIRPLKGEQKTELITSPKAKNDILVMDALDTNLKEQLKSFGVKKVVIDRINEFVNSKKAVVKSHNKQSQNREKNIIKNGGKNLLEIHKSIQKIQDELEVIRKWIVDFLQKNKLEVSEYDIANNENVKKFIIKNIENTYPQEINLKQKDLKQKLNTKIVFNEDIFLEVSLKIKDILKQLDTDHGTVEQYVKTNKLKNEDFSSQTNSKKTVTQKANKVWVVLEDNDDNVFKIHLVVAFKILEGFSEQEVLGKKKLEAGKKEKHQLETTGVPKKNFEDIASIRLSVYVPDQAEEIPKIAKSKLITKLNQITTKNGLGGASANLRFIIASKIDVLTKDITPTSPAMNALTLGISFYVGDGVEGILFGNEYIEVKGVGSNETKAYISAIKRIKSSSPKLKEFLENGKIKILEYYNRKCDFIIQKAEALSNQNKYDEAIYQLMAIPEDSKECYSKSINVMNIIYQKKIDDDAKIKLQKSRGLWSTSQTAETGREIVEILATIAPNAKEFKNVKTLYTEIKKRVQELEKRELDIKLKEVGRENERIEVNRDIELQRIKVARDVGVSYGKNQPEKVYYNVGGWFGK